MKKVLMFSCLLFLFAFLVGCDNESIEKENVSNQKIIHEHCTRSGFAGEDNVVTLYYDIYYQGDVLKRLESYEGIESSDSSLLDQYEKSYRSVHENYNGLDYYQTSVLRDDTHVVSQILIDYENIDIERLIEIEGEEDNIFENKVPKASKWKELAKKVGAKCSVVEE